MTRARRPPTVFPLLAALLAAFAWPAAGSDPPLERCSKARSALAGPLAAALATDPHDDPASLDTDVVHLRLDIEVRPSDRWLGGSATITIASRREGLTRYVFRLDDGYTISAVAVDGRSAAFRRLDLPRVEVTLPRALASGETFTLRVDYRGTPIRAPIRFSQHGSAAVVSTLSEPFDAYGWWPAKEDNRDKLTAELWVTVPASLGVVANGTLAGTDPVSGSRRRYRWQTSYPTAPYLLAFSATNYTTFSTTFPFEGGSMPVGFYLYPEDDSPGNRAAWGRVVDMLEVFGSLFGRYPFVAEKYAIYEFPFGGGMEHQTATGQGGRAPFAESLTAHELAHQWWGDEVTCATWHDIWLNEGLATYAEVLWEENRSGTALAAELKAAMAARRPEDASGTVYVYDTSDVSRIFSTDLTYLKAGWVLHMLRRVVGDSAFLDILHELRRRFALASAGTEDFRAIAEGVSGRDLGWFFSEWIYGPGLPTYALGWRTSVAGGRRWLELEVRQEQDDSIPAFVMPLDVNVSAAGVDAVRTVWNDARDEHLLLAVEGAVDRVTLDPGGWLLHGGVRAVAFAPGPPKVVAVRPAPGSRSRPGSVSRVEVTFHEDVTLGPGDLVLGGARGGPVAATVAYDRAAQTAVLTPAAPLPPDEYTLTVRDTVTGAVSGQALDGELSSPVAAAALPSGDGRPGGAAVVRFAIGGAPRSRLFARGGATAMPGWRGAPHDQR